jgi:hypothetical protein
LAFINSTEAESGEKEKGFQPRRIRGSRFKIRIAGVSLYGQKTEIIRETGNTLK